VATTKLTLSADEEVVSLARAQSRRDGISISSMFSDFIRARSRIEKRSSVAAGPLSRRAMRIGQRASRAAATDPDRKLAADALIDKYGGRR